jgi:hypothetical protein
VKFDEDSIIRHPEKLEQDWLYPSDTDYVFLGVFLPLAFMTLALFQGLGLLIVGVAFVGCWFQLLNGRVYYVLGGIKPRNFWNDRILRHNLWEAEPKHPLLARLLRPPPPNARLAINQVGDLGLIYNNSAKTDTLLVGGLGSDIYAHNIHAQARIIERVGDSIKRIASFKKYEVIVGFVNMRRPSVVREMLSIYDDHIHPAFLPRDPVINPWPPEEDPEEERGDQNIAKVMEDVLFIERDVNSRTTMLVTITIRRDAFLRKAARKGGSMAEDAEERSLIEEIAEVAEDALANCEIADPHAFSVMETHEHLRYVWDIHQDDEYAGWKDEVGADPEHPEHEYFVKFFHWPKQFIRAFRTYCDLDGSLHAILRVVENPDEADPMSFLEMFAIDVPNVTVALVGKTVKSRRTVRFMERSSRIESVFKDMTGIADDTQAAIEREERTQTKLETAHRSRFTQLFNIVVVVSATNKSDLNNYVKVATRQIHAIDGVYAKRVKGSFLQVPWLLTAHGAPV